MVALEMVGAVLIAVLFAVLRCATGYFGKAAKDGYLEDFDPAKLGGTVAKFVGLCVTAYFGADIAPVVTGFVLYAFEFFLSELSEKLK